MLTVIKQHPKEILLSALARMAEQAPFYIFTAFIFAYGIGTLHVSRNFLLAGRAGGFRAVVYLRSRCSVIYPTTSAARTCT